MNRLGDRRGDFRLAGPKVLQVDRPTVAADAQGLRGEVDVDRAGQGVGDDQRRAGEVHRLAGRVDSALEVPIAAQHRCRHEVAVDHGLAHRRRQRAAVADAGHAAVGDGMKAQCFERLVQACLPKIVGHHAAAGRKAGFDVRFDLQSPLDGLLGQQAGAPA